MGNAKNAGRRISELLVEAGRKISQEKFIDDLMRAVEVTRSPQATKIQSKAGDSKKGAPEVRDTHEKHSKKTDLSRYMETAKLTDRQYQVASLRWEYGLSISQIARELGGKHRSTVQQHLAAAQAKMARSGNREKVRKALAKMGSDTD